MCSPPYEPIVVMDLELTCTPASNDAADTGGVQILEDVCQIHELDKDATYILAVPFRGVPRYGSVTSDLDKFQFIDAFQSVGSHAAAARAFIFSDERSRYSGRAIRNRYEVKIGETLEQSCASAVAENHDLHEKARSLDGSCMSDFDCAEHSRFDKERACFDETVAYNVRLRDEALDRSGVKATTYCELRSPGLGSSYCEAGESPPREHHTRCIQGQCTVFFETHAIPKGK